MRRSTLESSLFAFHSVRKQGLASPLAVAAFLIFPAAAAIAAQDPTPPAVVHETELPARELIDAFVDKEVRTMIETDSVPGLSIAIGVGGDLLLAKGYGHADQKATVPATADTIYPIGTLTREFTAVAILQLVESEKLSLDDELSKLLPEFPTQGKKITLRQLLANTAGIPSYAKLLAHHLARGTGVVRGTRPAAADEFHALFRDVPLDFEPGQGFSLDNSGYVLLSMILAKHSGESYADYLQSKMLAPLGMEHTSFCAMDPRPIGFAEGCTTVADISELEMPSPAAHPFSTQNLCSSVKDIFLWQRAIVDRMLIGERSYRQMVTPAKLSDGNTSSYGFALSMSWLGKLKVYAHTGGIGGFRSRLAYYSHPDVSIVVLANCASAKVEELERAIARFLFGQTPAAAIDLPLEAKDMERYLGTYQIATTQVRIMERGGKLYFDHPTQPGFGLRFQGEHVFVAAQDPDVRFTFDGAGEKALSFTILRGGFLSTAKRME